MDMKPPAEPDTHDQLPPSAAATALRWEKWGGGLIVLATLTYLYSRHISVALPVGSVKMTLPALSFLLLSLFGLWFFFRGRAGSITPWGRRLLIGSAFFLFGLLLSGWNALDRFGWIKEIVHVMTLMVTGAGLAILFRRSVLRYRFMVTFVCVMIASSLWGLVQAFTHQGGDKSDNLARAAAGTHGGSMLAQFLYTALIFILAAFPIMHDRKIKIASLFAALLLIGTIAVTFTRGVFLYMAVSMIVFLVFHFRRYLSPVGFLTAMMVAAGVLMILLMSPERREAFVSRMIRMESDNNQYRMMIWKTGGKLFEKHPVFGAGFNNYAKHLDIYSGEEDPHNLLIRLLAETGVVGLTFFFFWMGIIGWILWRIRSDEIGCGLLALWIGWLVFSCFQPILASSYGITFTLICALGMGIHHQKYSSPGSA